MFFTSMLALHVQSLFVLSKQFMISFRYVCIFMFVRIVRRLEHYLDKQHIAYVYSINKHHVLHSGVIQRKAMFTVVQAS